MLTRKLNFKKLFEFVWAHSDVKTRAYLIAIITFKTVVGLAIAYYFSVILSLIYFAAVIYFEYKDINKKVNEAFNEYQK